MQKAAVRIQIVSNWSLRHKGRIFRLEVIELDRKIFFFGE